LGIEDDPLTLATLENALRCQGSLSTHVFLTLVERAVGHNKSVDNRRNHDASQNTDRRG
jgi:hypothetical protein